MQKPDSGVEEDSRVLSQAYKKKLADARSTFVFHNQQGHRPVVPKEGVRLGEDVRLMWHNDREVHPWLQRYLRLTEGAEGAPAEYCLAQQGPWSNLGGVADNVLFNIWTGLDITGRETHTHRGQPSSSLQAFGAHLCASQQPSKGGAPGYVRLGYAESPQPSHAKKKGDESLQQFVRPERQQQRDEQMGSAGMNASIPIPDCDGVCSMHAGERSKIVAFGYESGVVRVVRLGDCRQGGVEATTLWEAAFTQGPVWVAVDEEEAHLWVACITGEVFLQDLHAAGMRGATPRLVGAHSKMVYTAAFNTQRGYFVTGDAKGDIATWSAQEEVNQPRHLFSAPQKDSWYVLATAHDHIVAARHNPEVFIFTLAGSSQEARTLSSSENTRQVRNISVSKTFYVVGFSDGTVQRIPFAARAPHNVFSKPSKRDHYRTIVHRAEGPRFPVSSMALPGESEDKAVVLSCGKDGVYATDLTHQIKSQVTRLLSSPVGHLCSAEGVFFATASGCLVVADASAALPAPKTYPLGGRPAFDEALLAGGAAAAAAATHVCRYEAFQDRVLLSAPPIAALSEQEMIEQARAQARAEFAKENPERWRQLVERRKQRAERKRHRKGGDLQSAGQDMQREHLADVRELSDQWLSSHDTLGDSAHGNDDGSMQAMDEEDEDADSHTQAVDEEGRRRREAQAQQEAEQVAAQLEARRAEEAKAAAVEERMRAEREAEVRRLEAAREAEAQRVEAEHRVEAERAEEEREAAEARRMQDAEEAQRVETARLAEVERMEAEREAERLDEERVAAEEAETQRLEAERLAAEAQRLEAERQAEEVRQAEEERAAAEAQCLEEQREAEEAAEAQRLEAERMAAEAQRLQEQREAAEAQERERERAVQLEELRRAAVHQEEEHEAQRQVFVEEQEEEWDRIVALHAVLRRRASEMAELRQRVQEMGKAASPTSDDDSSGSGSTLDSDDEEVERKRQELDTMAERAEELRRKIGEMDEEISTSEDEREKFRSSLADSRRSLKGVKKRNERLASRLDERGRQLAKETAAMSELPPVDEMRAEAEQKAEHALEAKRAAERTCTDVRQAVEAREAQDAADRKKWHAQREQEVANARAERSHLQEDLSEAQQKAQAHKNKLRDLLVHLRDMEDEIPNAREQALARSTNSPVRASLGKHCVMPDLSPSRDTGSGVGISDESVVPSLPPVTEQRRSTPRAGRTRVPKRGRVTDDTMSIVTHSDSPQFKRLRKPDPCVPAPHLVDDDETSSTALTAVTKLTGGSKAAAKQPTVFDAKAKGVPSDACSITSTYAPVKIVARDPHMPAPHLVDDDATSSSGTTTTNMRSALTIPPAKSEEDDVGAGTVVSALSDPIKTLPTLEPCVPAEHIVDDDDDDVLSIAMTAATNYDSIAGPAPKVVEKPARKPAAKISKANPTAADHNDACSVVSGFTAPIKTLPTLEPCAPAAHIVDDDDDSSNAASASTNYDSIAGPAPKKAVRKPAPKAAEEKSGADDADDVCSVASTCLPRIKKMDKPEWAPVSHLVDDDDVSSTAMTAVTNYDSIAGPVPKVEKKARTPAPKAAEAKAPSEEADESSSAASTCPPEVKTVAEPWAPAEHLADDDEASSKATLAPQRGSSAGPAPKEKRPKRKREDEAPIATQDTEESQPATQPTASPQQNTQHSTQQSTQQSGASPLQPAAKVARFAPDTPQGGAVATPGGAKKGRTPKSQRQKQKQVQTPKSSGKRGQGRTPRSRGGRTPGAKGLTPGAASRGSVASPSSVPGWLKESPGGVSTASTASWLRMPQSQETP